MTAMLLETIEGSETVQKLGNAICVIKVMKRSTFRSYYCNEEGYVLKGKRK